MKQTQEFFAKTCVTLDCSTVENSGIHPEEVREGFTEEVMLQLDFKGDELQLGTNKERKFQGGNISA